MSGQLEFRQTSAAHAMLDTYSTLLSSAFPGAESRFTPAYLSWLYNENPSGKVVGTDAWDGEKLAAHYVCVPFSATIAGEQRKGLLSLNTATHPDYQGRGLFTQLARQTYERAAGEGYAAVVGVANANSTPGFVKKLNFQLVAPLRAMIGVGSPRFDADSLNRDASAFTRQWSDTDLAWRMRNPINPVRLVDSSSGAATLCAATDKPFIRAWSRRPIQTRIQATAPQLQDRAAHLFLGLFPESAGSLPLFVDIPERLRPVPLNFIYLALDSSLPPKIDKNQMYFDFLDFDAY